jgi:hypothetical protein
MRLKTRHGGTTALVVWFVIFGLGSRIVEVEVRLLRYFGIGIFLFIFVQYVEGENTSRTDEYQELEKSHSHMRALSTLMPKTSKKNPTARMERKIDHCGFDGSNISYTGLTIQGMTSRRY